MDVRKYVTFYIGQSTCLSFFFTLCKPIQFSVRSSFYFGAVTFFPSISKCLRCSRICALKAFFSAQVFDQYKPLNAQMNQAEVLLCSESVLSDDIRKDRNMSTCVNKIQCLIIHVIRIVCLPTECLFFMFHKSQNQLH